MEDILQAQYAAFRDQEDRIRVQQNQQTNIGEEVSGEVTLREYRQWNKAEKTWKFSPIPFPASYRKTNKGGSFRVNIEFSSVLRNLTLLKDVCRKPLDGGPGWEVWTKVTYDNKVLKHFKKHPELIPDDLMGREGYLVKHKFVRIYPNQKVICKAQDPEQDTSILRCKRSKTSPRHLIVPSTDLKIDGLEFQQYISMRVMDNNNTPEQQKEDMVCLANIDLETGITYCCVCVSVCV